jgi:hypothetical protein
MNCRFPRPRTCDDSRAGSSASCSPPELACIRQPLLILQRSTSLLEPILATAPGNSGSVPFEGLTVTNRNEKRRRLFGAL